MERFARALELTSAYFAIGVLMILVVATNSAPPTYAAVATAGTTASTCSAPSFYSLTVTPASLYAPWNLPLLSTIDGPYLPKVTATGLPPGIVLDDQQTTLSTGGAVLHNWILDGTPTQLGTYSATITAQNSCGGASTIVTVPINAPASTGAAVSFDTSSLTTAVPNPVITGISNTQNVNLAVQNSAGLTIFSSPPSPVVNGHWSVQLSNLLSGIYRLSLSNNGSLLVPATLNVTLTSSVVPAAPTGQTSTTVPAQTTPIVTTTTSSPTITTTTNTSAQCPNLSFTMQIGGSGQAVVALQNFLISKGLLASGNASGYFGALTRAAIQQFQKQQGIVSSGTESTTGFGAVGVRTRAAIQANCQGGLPNTTNIPTQTLQCQQPSVPNCPGGTLLSRGVDQNHCSLGYQCQPAVPTQPIVTCPAVASVQCPSGTLAASNGTDSFGCNLGYSCVPLNVCRSYFTPTCASNQTLVSGGTDYNGCAQQSYCVNKPTTSCPVYNALQCAVGYHAQSQGNDANGCSLPATCVPDASSSNTISANTTLGAAPFAVYFTTSSQYGAPSISFGDGQFGMMTINPLAGVCNASQGVCNQSYVASHTYTSAGSYAVNGTVQPSCTGICLQSYVNFSGPTINVQGLQF